jgi:hypothetical protein
MVVVTLGMRRLTLEPKKSRVLFLGGLGPVDSDHAFPFKALDHDNETGREVTLNAGNGFDVYARAILLDST